MDLNKVYLQVISGLIVGLILGLGTAYFTLNERLLKIESRIEILGNISGLNNSTTILEDYHYPFYNSNLKIDQNNNSGKIIFEESFNDNTLGWGESNKDSLIRYFSNSKYIIDNGREKYTGWGYVEIPKLPVDFDIFLKFKWSSGSKDERFGLLILQDSDNYLKFGSTKNGYAGVMLVKDNKFDKWIINKKAGFSLVNNQFNNLIIEKRGNKYKWFINNKVVGDGILGEIEWNKIGVFCDGAQVVEFDHLIITEK